MKTHKPKTYTIVKKTTTNGNGHQTFAWEAYKDSILTRLGIYCYLDYVDFTRSEDSYDSCCTRLRTVVNTVETIAVSIIEIG